MTSPASATDIDGAKVRIGDTVRVLSIDPPIKIETDAEEKVMSMVGEEFEVEEIDEHGHAWVTKWWHPAEDQSEAHSISLSRQQMKLVRSRNGS